MTSSNPFSRRQLLGGLAALTVGGVLASAGCSSSADTPSGSSASGWSLPSTDPTATIKVLSILDLKTAKTDWLSSASFAGVERKAIGFEEVIRDADHRDTRRLAHHCR